MPEEALAQERGGGWGHPPPNVGGPGWSRSCTPRPTACTLPAAIRATIQAGGKPARCRRSDGGQGGSEVGDWPGPRSANLSASECILCPGLVAAAEMARPLLDTMADRLRAASAAR